MMLSRRDLLAGAGGAAAIACAALPMKSAFAAPLRKIGLQLYTVRDIFAKDPAGTLEQVARVGYREVEFGGGGYDAMDHAMLRKTMDRLGLKAPSIHVGYDLLLGSFEKSVAMAKTLGADTVILPYMTDEHRNEAAWQVALPNISRIGAQLQKAGLGFAYHNHDFEFTTRPGGISLYERLVTGVDPALMKVELDLYWAAHAGEDLPSLIAKLAGRLYSYHVKDMRPDRSMAAVGQGTIDFAALFKLPGSAGVRHFFVENDQAPAPYIPDITASFATLSKLRS
jgi:sugar phosphate isomerase/epimerase